MHWYESWRFDPQGAALADRHYSRRAVGAPQFVPPGRCLVLTIPDQAVWVTSWPFAEYTRHAWAGAWMCSLFRNECPEVYRSSDLIREAVAATRWRFGEPPPEGVVTFVNPAKVPGVPVRGRRVYGWSFGRAGFRHVGFTKGGLWAWQLQPEAMPESEPPILRQPSLFAG